MIGFKGFWAILIFAALLFTFGLILAEKPLVKRVTTGLSLAVAVIDIFVGVLNLNSARIVVFNDQVLEEAVGKIMGLENQTIPISEAKKLRKLDLDKLGIEDLTGLEEFTNLTSLNLEKNNITDLSPLKGLKNLSILHLENNNITDLRPLKGL